MELLENEIVESMAEEWFNSGKLETYMQSRYEKWLVSHNGSYVEIFISDDEIDNLDDNVGYEDSFNIVGQILSDNGIELEGEPQAWATDSLREGTLTVYAFSEMIPYSDMEIELDNDGNILYMTCDNETKKELIENAKRKY